MRLIPLLLICSLFIKCSFAQIKPTGYANYNWGEAKKNVPVSDCSTKTAGEHFENCSMRSADSLFIGKYKYSYSNFRFYNDKLLELNFDLAHTDLATLVADLTIKFGYPKVKENKQDADDTNSMIIGYEWNVGDTHILVVNKGRLYPVWCTLSSIKQRKLIRDNSLDVEKILFD